MKRQDRWIDFSRRSSRPQAALTRPPRSRFVYALQQDHASSDSSVPSLNPACLIGRSVFGAIVIVARTPTPYGRSAPASRSRRPTGRAAPRQSSAGFELTLASSQVFCGHVACRLSHHST
jgi:hypothetical protein